MYREEAEHLVEAIASLVTGRGGEQYPPMTLNELKHWAESEDDLPRFWMEEDSFLADLDWVGKVAICAIKGHDLEDSGYGSPESGCIRMGCRRCGYSYPTHWLY